MSDGDLYPSGPPTLAMHDDRLRRHARRLQTSLEQDRAMAERVARLERDLGDQKSAAVQRLDKVDREMGEQTKMLTDIRIAQAANDSAMKRWQIACALLTPVLGAIAIFVSAYLARAGHP